MPQAPLAPPPGPAGPPPRALRPETPFRRGFGLGAGAGLGAGLALIAGSLVASILGGIALMGLGAAASSVTGANQTGVEPLATVWGPSTARDTLRSIPIRGAMMTSGADGLGLTAGTYGYEVADVLDGMTAESAGGVVLTMNTPGGSIAGARAIADAVDRYRERTGKKVYAYVEDMSASAGMYAMAGADEIVVEHGSVVGSIGVIMGPLERYRNVTATGSILGAVQAERIESEYITAGTGKDSGNPFRDMTPAERAELQAIVDEFYGDFVDHVAAKRSIDRAVIVDQLGAAIFAPRKAKEVGLIDAELGRDEAMRRFASDAGLDPANTRVVEAAAPTMWAQLLGAADRPWGVAPAALPIDGQPARATSTLCTQARTPLAYHGSIEAVCG
ncbi:S49 family peptidase [Propioniciclava coleopterorum]|uniref:S49 family peptidase n=1 Tax=Propioniciclava coleopterorum TaxID=2714937 RepID=A0A6G7Y489_9ACTN|nr:S49 family peptidase [Propioniciclava coleopterorum]QIK71704.1 S49 family peptidase [Propioniciclava coleopterorum]